MSQVLRVGRGFTAAWVVTLRDESGAQIVGTYTGDEPLSLVLRDADGIPLVPAGSSAAWLVPAAGKILLTLDDSDTATLPVGRRGLSIRLVDGGEPIEAFRAILLIEPRPLIPE